MQLLVHTGTDPAAFYVAPGHDGAIRPKRCKGRRGGANLLHISQPLLRSPIAPNNKGTPVFPTFLVLEPQNEKGAKGYYWGTQRPGSEWSALRIASLPT